MLVIVRALGPLIVLAVVVLASWAMVNSITKSARAYSASVGESLEETKAMFSSVGQALDEVGVFVTGVSTAVTDAVGTVGAFPTQTSIRLPDITIPKTPLGLGLSFPRLQLLGAQDFNVNIPGAKEVGQFFTGAAAAGKQVSATIGDEISSIFTAPVQITDIADATGAFAGEVRSSVVGWLKVVIVSLLASVVVWFAFKVATVVGEVKRGWAMLRGVVPPAFGVEQLRAQLAELETRIAALA
jgi:hypothetical protein